MFTPDDDSLQASTTVLQQAPPAFLSRTATSTGPENVVALSSELSGVGGGGAGPEASGAGLEFSLGEGGGAEERCEGCGRTFAPGRLQSHAKVGAVCGSSQPWVDSV